MEFGVLGPLDVRTGAGVEVALRRGRPRTLLLALLIRPGRAAASDLLIDALWGDDVPRNPVNALQIQVSYLRKVLASAEPDGASLLETRSGGYALTVEPERVDAHRFEAAVRRLGPLDAIRSARELNVALSDVDAALGLWRGDALQDVALLDFARAEATRLDELRWAAIEHRIELLLRLGRHGEAAGDLAELVQRMPLRERLHEQLVLALYRSGRQADALRAYQEARRMLAEELGIDPGPGLRALEDAVLRQDQLLEWTPPEPGPPYDDRPDDAARDPRPAAGRRGARGQPPVPLSPLVGRESELGRLRPLLEGHRVLTLTGPGGAGKTRLAIELARRQSDPVWYVDLSPIDDPSLTASTVAAAAGVTIAPDDDPVDAVATAVASQSALLVLDTCEHLVGPVARLVAAVLRDGPSIRVLATSRRALGLAGELAWPVPPLELPPSGATSAAEIASHAAVALFVERATAVRPDLAIDDMVAQDIASICTSLDGLPLAIELAAARADVLSPAAIRDRLQDRFVLLIDGGTDATERQQTLRAAIDWSFELLSAEQRHFFARLGTFAGSFDLDAALTVAGAGCDSPLELLASLVKQSMVARSGQDRYRLLDSLRAYALEVLADLDADDTRERHAAFYVGLAEEGESHIRGPEQLRWLERFRLDINNFRVAIEWSLLTGNIERAARHAGALGWFWTLNGMLSEAVQQLERVVRSGELPPGIQARCLWGYGLLAASLGRLETARDAGHRAAELAAAIGDHSTTGYGLNAAAVAEWALGHHAESLAAHRAAIELFERCDDRWGRAVCTVLQARTLLDQDDPTAALVAREGVDHARRAGDRHLLGIALTQIAHISAAGGDHQAAISAATEALALQEQIGYSEGAVSALHVLGQSYRLAGDRAEARRLHQRALGQAFRIGHAAAVCEAVEDLARTDADERPGFALMLFRAASAERRARALPLRRRDADELGRLEATLAEACCDAMTDRPFADVVAELVG